MTDDERDDAAAYASAYRRWRQRQYDDTPVEYHTQLDTSRRAFDAACETPEATSCADA
ncbi:hypothetical protein [Gemmatimonas sp.]|uniref:hypothetical protein n=1 Tax=Gemmatimonas sp. TaxID=1962908 RepID=UPI0025C68C3B|nr:hypothetical protein [Gemmatimonas sp.]MCA2991179.1 hypothetical protein [Gemmatimonas sp.]